MGGSAKPYATGTRAQTGSQEDAGTQTTGQETAGKKGGNDQENHQEKDTGTEEDQITGMKDIWKGETVFIIGGGPSLINFDFSPIHNRKVIAVNNAYGDPVKDEAGNTVCYCPRWWVDVCWFGDLKWWQWHKNDLKRFSGIIAHCNDKSSITKIKWIVAYQRGKPSGLIAKEGAVAWNRCSGFSAINLAYHMGASTVFLLGFDMSHNGVQRNWHNDHKEQCTFKDAEGRYAHYMVSCKYIAKDAESLGLEIINGNPDSAIEAFPKMELKAFLKKEKQRV
jgi:hypothetical protein